MDWTEFFFGGWDHPLETLKSDLIGFTSGAGLPIQQAAGLTNADAGGGGDDFTTWFSGDTGTSTGGTAPGSSSVSYWAIAIVAIIGIVAVALLLKEAREF